MKCPKCKHEQKNTVECEQCGIFFAKYANRKETVSTVKQPRKKAPPNSSFIKWGFLSVAIIYVLSSLWSYLAQPSESDYIVLGRQRIQSTAELGVDCRSVDAKAYFSTYASIFEGGWPVDHLRYIESGAQSLQYFSYVISDDDMLYSHVWYKNGIRIAEIEFSEASGSNNLLSQQMLELVYDDVVEVLTVDDSGCLVSRESIISRPFDSLSAREFSPLSYESPHRLKIKDYALNGDSNFIVAARQGGKKKMQALFKLLKRSKSKVQGVLRDNNGLGIDFIASDNGEVATQKVIDKQRPDLRIQFDGQTPQEYFHAFQNKIKSSPEKALRHALMRSSIPLARMVLDHGQEKKGAIGLAIMRNDESMLRFLISMGLPLAARANDGKVNGYLRTSILNSQPQLAKVLIVEGVALQDENDKRRESVIASAIKRCQYGVVDLLIKADVSTANTGGKRLLDVMDACPNTKKWAKLRAQLPGYVAGADKESSEPTIALLTPIVREAIKGSSLCNNIPGRFSAQPPYPKTKLRIGEMDDIREWGKMGILNIEKTGDNTVMASLTKKGSRHYRDLKPSDSNEFRGGSLLCFGRIEFESLKIISDAMGTKEYTDIVVEVTTSIRDLPSWITSPDVAHYFILRPILERFKLQQHREKRIRLRYRGGQWKMNWNKHVYF